MDPLSVMIAVLVAGAAVLFGAASAYNSRVLMFLALAVGGLALAVAAGGGA